MATFEPFSTSECSSGGCQLHFTLWWEQRQLLLCISLGSGSGRLEGWHQIRVRRSNGQAISFHQRFFFYGRNSCFGILLGKLRQDRSCVMFFEVCGGLMVLLWQVLPDRV